VVVRDADPTPNADAVVRAVVRVADAIVIAKPLAVRAVVRVADAIVIAKPPAVRAVVRVPDAIVIAKPLAVHPEVHSAIVRRAIAHVVIVRPATVAIVATVAVIAVRVRPVPTRQHRRPTHPRPMWA
jgi:hypothetical protein